MSEAKIRTNIMAEYSASFEGKPVYSRYSDSQHTSQAQIRPNRERSIIVGLDFGLNPAAVFTQLDSLGRLMVFDELAPEDIAFDEFIDELLVPMLRETYAGYNIVAVGDPSGASRNALSLHTAYSLLAERGVHARKAFTNDIQMRRDSVSYFLGRRSGLVLDKRCTTLREGFQGGYCFAKLKGTERLRSVPEKNKFSHVHDALQYAAMYFYRGGEQPRRPVRVTSLDALGADRPASKPFLFA
jgi:hypothetical protein